MEKMQIMIKEVEKMFVEETERLAIEAVEKAMVEEMERLATQESTKNTNIKVEVSVEIEELKSKCTSLQGKGSKSEELKLVNEFTDENLKLQRMKSDNGTSMKDIPLDHVSDCSFYGRSGRDNGGADDQMLELWETAEQHCRQDPVTSEIENQAFAPREDVAYHRFADSQKIIQNSSSEVQVEKELGIDKLEVSLDIQGPSHEGKKEKILERLASDAQKLISLQTIAQDLNKKMETNKKGRKANGSEYETVKTHLHEVEEAVVQLAEINDQLKKNIEESPLNEQTSMELEEAGNVWRERILEQASKGSEKIGRLQFELQNIHYILLKLEDESKNKGRNGFYVSRTGVLLKDFIYSGRSSERRKKARVCGCMRPSTNGD